jgi:hypothetical protein
MELWMNGQTKVYKCVDKFKGGWMSVVDNVHFG